MKKLAIALLVFGVPMGASAQSVGNLGFTPPNVVPGYNNLGGTLSGVQTGITAFTLTDVRTIPVLNAGGTALQSNVNGFFNIVRPAPVQPVP